MIPIAEVKLDARAESLVLEVLRSGRLAQGPMVAAFEAGFAQVAGCAYAVAVNSGTAALEAAFHALDLGPGDELVTSPFTFAATLNAALAAGVTVRFADVDDDFCINPASVGSLVNERTRALVPVHLYGCPADMDALIRLADRSGLAVVEDAAQAPGAAVADRPVGSFGVGCFSFYATKNLTTGEGGMVTTGDGEVADRLRAIRNQGMRERYEYVMIGRNLRMTEVAAAIGLAQLEALETGNETRRRNARALNQALAGVAGLVLPREVPGRTHVFHQYTIRLAGALPRERDDLVAALRDDGVGAEVYYPRLVFDYKCYDGHPGVGRDDVPRARAAVNEVISLPVHPGVSDADVELIAGSIRKRLG